MDKIITSSEKETFNFAKKFSRELKGGSVLGLIGDLGAGKTVFTKGLAAGLGIKETVTSPTFVLMKVYEVKNSECGMRNFVHIDAYRINSPRDLIAIGVEEYFNRSDTVTVIEWADKTKKIWPEKIKIITIESKEINIRKIIIN